MDDNSLNELTASMETSYIKLLIQLLKTGSYTPVDVQAKTQRFLSIFPFQSLADADQKLQSLTQEHKELVPLYIQFLQSKEDNKSHDLLSQTREQLSSLQTK